MPEDMKPEHRKNLEAYMQEDGITWKNEKLWRKGHEVKPRALYNAWSSHLPENTQLPTFAQFKETAEEIAQETAEAQDTKGKGQSARLVAFVRDHADLLRDGEGEGYVQIHSTREALHIGSERFSTWVTDAFSEENGGEVLTEKARKEASTVLAGAARREGKSASPVVRAASMPGAYFLDLCEQGNSVAVGVGPDGWDFTEDGEDLPLCFLRPGGQYPIDPRPERGNGSALERLERLLYPHLTSPADCHVVELAWVTMACRPGEICPILELTGAQGSGKSSTMDKLVALVDPVTKPGDEKAARALAQPDERNIAATAHNRLIYRVDNASFLTMKVQDTLCLVATGGEFSARTLYSNAGVSRIRLQRPVAMNGINPVARNADLADRCISIECERLGDRRKTEGELATSWRRNLGLIRGAVLDTFAEALRIEPDVPPEYASRDRLAGFVLWGVAVARAMGLDDEAFLGPFTRLRLRGRVRIVQASPDASVLLEYLRENPKGATHTATEWRNELERSYPEKTSCPKTGQEWADRVARLIEPLREVGVECVRSSALGGPRGRQGTLWVVHRLSGFEEHWEEEERAHQELQDEGFQGRDGF